MWLRARNLIDRSPSTARFIFKFSAGNKSRKGDEWRQPPATTAAAGSTQACLRVTPVELVGCKLQVVLVGVTEGVKENTSSANPPCVNKG